MQLSPRKNPTSLRTGLALAAASLLGPKAASAVIEDVEVGSGVLVYTEPGRVSALEAVALVTRNFWDKHKLSLRVVYDTLTGASPNGAVASRSPQTFTRPSGSGSYTVNANETPLDDTFKDTRFAGSLTYDRPFLSAGRWNVGLQGSSEHDYLSIGASTGITREFDRKNTTISLGVSGSRDEISPEGGVPTAFAEMGAATGHHEDDFTRGDDGEYDENRGEGSGDTKSVVDGVVGLTQVVNRTTLIRFNYSISNSSGYLNDPYKFVSVLYGPDDPSAGDPITYLYEKRPDSHTKHSIYAQAKKRIASTTMDISYRFLWDDWGITSHTAELKHRVPIGETVYFEPHVRLYEQTAADFYRTYLLSGEALPAEASADPRLGPMTAITVGNRVGGFHVGEQEFAVTLEYYRQFLKDGDQPAFGSLEGLDLSEDMGAFMFRISHGWEP